ncbi:Alpha,alpha-trehalose-phosphate synthase [UDP-forming] 1 [Gracilariopsis chorda]|uniref:Alpha,alpha-trehalose-phosphate synthase [UDP-forming] 1 n=1 Tax=Gracilariopsis chorda TaxID=448386 RepID=A0A2V3IQ11_9FLOR|nr:Alpha,alpha-trehalose-phosphate synthase [UDP-forming] 1 [Gracilariopsis chorda]|eukprot:PXF44147.1 Alpha,alpha-trehalose-phosphate synthase [UDP-forming] 1 [Gracilariopsis chorda]
MSRPPKPPANPQSPPTPSTPSHPSPLDLHNTSPQHSDLARPHSPLLTAAAFPQRPFLRPSPTAAAADPDRAYLRVAEAELLDEIQAVRDQLRLARQRASRKRNRRLRRTSSVGDDVAHHSALHAVSKQLSSSTDKPMRRRIISVSLRLPTARERTSIPRQLFDNALPPNAIFTLRDATNLPIVWVGSVNPNPSNSSPTSLSNATTPTLNDRCVAFDDPPVEQTYRKRRTSRYSANRDRHHHVLESRSVAVPLPVEPQVMDRFYFFCEHILWRLLHYDYGSVDKKGSELDEYFAAYRFVNQRFVETISEIYEDGDLIWVHNYHLMLLPSLLRESLWYAKIGFFLYTPFPSAELFRILPYRTQILRGVIGADVIGFYSYDYSKQFVSACSRLLGIDGTPSYVEADPSTGRRCELAIYPAGIDVSSLRNFVSSKPVKSRIAELRARFEGLHILVGVDRLDDSFCGIPLKLLAFEQLLQNNPKLRGKVMFIQVATIPGQAHSTTTFRQQQMQVNGLVGRINSLFGTFSFNPVHYINGELDPMELYALMSIGHACIVSPIRDGMALIPHEWTVCQHGAYKGAIVISEFAGAAQSFSTALHVNPWNVDEMVEKIKKALTMDDKERAMRNEAAYSFVTTHTAKLWGLNFLEDLEQCERVTASGSGVATPVLDIPTVIHAYLGMAGTTSQVPSGTVRSSLQASGIAGHSPSELSSVLLNTFGPAVRLPGFSDQKMENALRNNLPTPTAKGDSVRASPDISWAKLNSRAALFILDLDGTLVPFQAITELGAPAQNIIDLIQSIKESSPRNYVLVTSSRDPNTVHKWLGNLSIYLAAEDGAFFRAPGDTVWTSLFRDNSGHDFQLNRSANSQPTGSDHTSLNSTSADSEQKRQPQLLKDDDQKRKKSSPNSSVPDVFGETNGTKKDRKDVPLQEGHHRYTSSSFASVSSSESMQNGEFTTSRPWKSLVKPAMQHFYERTPGVVIEEGDVTVTWHYIDSDTDFGRWQARDLFEHLESFLLQRLNVDLQTDSHRRWIKVRPKGVDKTTAVTRTIEHIKSNEKASTFDNGQAREPLYIDFVLCVGDDKTDEGMFDMLKDRTRLEAIGIRAPNRVFTCRVGSPVTSASYFLDSPARVVELLEEITSCTVSVPSQ